MGMIRRTLIVLVSLWLMSAIAFADESTFFIYNGNVQPYIENINELDDVKQITSLGDGYSTLTNFPDGYSIDVPSDMVIDVSMSPVRTVLANNQSQIEIYHDNFNGTVHSGNSYSIYSNMTIPKTNWHTVTLNKRYSVNGLKVKAYGWTRKKLTHVTDDMNYYLNLEFFKSWNEVYTVIIKSEAPITDYARIMNSFKTVSKQGNPQYTRTFDKRVKPMEPELEDFYNSYFNSTSELKWGVFHPPSPRDMDDLNKLETDLGYEFDILVRYHTFDTPVPMEELQAAYDEQKYLELTLQTMYYGRTDNQAMLYRILDGEFDWYLRKYAQDLKTFGHPVLFRLNNEMNGDWCVYSAYHHGKDTEVYKESWKYVYRLFKEEGVDNVLWVWNPHDLSFPGFKWNHYLNYFPGEDYVDIVGLTGYNTGTYYKGEVWRTFDEIYPHIYKEYQERFNYPMMITEFGTNHVGGDKAAWIKDMLSKIHTYDEIKVAVWFNGTDYDSKGKPARVYRLDDSEEVMDVFRTHFSNELEEEPIEEPIIEEIDEKKEEPIDEENIETL